MSLTVLIDINLVWLCNEHLVTSMEKPVWSPEHFQNTKLWSADHIKFPLWVPAKTASRLLTMNEGIMLKQTILTDRKTNLSQTVIHITTSDLISDLD